MALYLYGSVAIDDFKQGWSDIDIIVLTQKEISQPQAEILVELRQTMLERFPNNPYFRQFEGRVVLETKTVAGLKESVEWIKSRKPAT